MKSYRGVIPAWGSTSRVSPVGAVVVGVGAGPAVVAVVLVAPLGEVDVVVACPVLDGVPDAFAPLLDGVGVEQPAAISVRPAMTVRRQMARTFLGMPHSFHIRLLRRPTRIRMSVRKRTKYSSARKITTVDEVLGKAIQGFALTVRIDPLGFKSHGSAGVFEG